MNIRYTTEIPDADSYIRLFETTDWNDRFLKSKEELHEAIKNSGYIVSAYEGENLVASGRYITDGYLHAYIFDLIVDPKYQDKGIGAEILSRLVAQARKYGIRDINLGCSKGKKGFYLKNGFMERLPEAPGMRFIVE